MIVVQLQPFTEAGYQRKDKNLLIGCCSSRYKVLAKQYKSMYPTLEMDVDGELAKLKVMMRDRSVEL